MDIRKAFKSRLLFVVTAIFLVLTTASALAFKKPNNSYQGLVDTWGGTMSVSKEGKEDGTVKLILYISSVDKNGMHYINGTISYKYEGKNGVKIDKKPIAIDKSSSYIDDDYSVTIRSVTTKQRDFVCIHGSYKNNEIKVQSFYFTYNGEKFTGVGILKRRVQK